MNGYAKIATLMGAYPEIAIIRRFAALNAQSILYLQAELINLESRLRRYEKEDRESGDQARKDYAVNWFELRNAVDLSSGSDGLSASSGKSVKEKDKRCDNEDMDICSGRRWELILEIREKLDQYNKAVLQQTAMAQLQKPNPRDLRFLNEWLERPDMGGVLLEGQDSDVWENPDRPDLIVLKARRNESLLSAWMSDRLIQWYHQTIGFGLALTEWSQRVFAPQLAKGSTAAAQPWSATPPVTDDEGLRLDSIARQSSTTYTSQTTLLRIARVFSMTLASLLPIASIVVLYYVKSMPKRLGIIGGFTAAFSFVLGLVTNGELVDVFAASAAFAAVQVVFVGSTTNQLGQGSFTTNQDGDIGKRFFV